MIVLTRSSREDEKSELPFQEKMRKVNGRSENYYVQGSNPRGNDDDDVTHLQVCPAAVYDSRRRRRRRRQQ
jgi:hypothetical protein